MNACPVNAIGVDETTGAKVVLDSLCIGCHLCTIACPFGTVFALPHAGPAAKCDLCGGAPACAFCCPTDAIQYIEQPGVGAWLASWGEKVHSTYVSALD
jgi:Fe-S-cluster-containing hydrogenase component 2